MREFGSSSLNLTGSLLIAHPGLQDPNFHRTVLFISDHNEEEGSFGLTLNRPSGRTVGDLLSGPDLQALTDVPVLLGGPVAQDQLIFAAFLWHQSERRMECRHHIGIEEAESLLSGGDAVIRAFVGYAGWSKGQLEGEIQQRAWLAKPPAPEVLDLDRIPSLWRELIGGFGPMFKLVAEAPDDLSQN